MGLSKSRYTKFCQCEKALWLSIYKSELNNVDTALQSRFESGTQVGDLAKSLLGNYQETTVVNEDGSLDYEAMIQRTKALMYEGEENIAEAAFSWNGNYCAVDILHRTEGGYAIYEVKSSSTSKEKETEKLMAYLPDVAYQKYVLEQSGVTVTGTFLVRLNKNYVRDKEIDIHELFIITDLAPMLAEESAKVTDNIARANKLLDNDKEPNVEMGGCCDKPYSCSFNEYCIRQLLDKSGADMIEMGSGTVFDLYRMTFEQKLRLVRQGKVTLDQLSPDEVGSLVGQIQVNNALSGEDHIEVDKIREFLDKNIHYPLYFLDFETMNLAVPLFPNSRPFQQIPFQYSLHYIKEENASLEHTEFLGDGISDPRRALAEQLLKDILGINDVGNPDEIADGLKKDVCVTAYNKDFECGRIQELANMYADIKEPLLYIKDRIVDLLDPFRLGYFYKASMNGSFSIKKVLPALFPDNPSLDYHNLQGVHNGGEAMNVYPLMSQMSHDEQQSVRENLLRYCKLDTYAMVKIWEKLVEVSG